MPELPDVESFRKYLEKTSLHQIISSIRVNQSRILEHISPNQLKDALQGSQFTGTLRHGKHLLVQTSGGVWFTMHFGMTGFLKYFESDSDDPPHDRLLILFDNGKKLAYISQRMFGRVGITPSVQSYIKRHNLGVDALQLEKGQFMSLVRGKKTPVKNVIMDQSLIAGIGNEYSDEILFQAGIHPLRKTDSLSDKELLILYSSIIAALGVAVNLNAEKQLFPDSFMLKHRGKSQRCPRCGTEIKTVKISGRTAYFCPGCQI